MGSADRAFARASLSVSNGSNTFTAVAQDSSGRADTNSVTVTLPATVIRRQLPDGSWAALLLRAFAASREPGGGPVMNSREDAKQGRGDEVLITRHGKPAAILIGFADEDEWFDYRVEHDPRFLKRMEDSRRQARNGAFVRLEELSGR